MWRGALLNCNLGQYDCSNYKVYNILILFRHHLSQEDRDICVGVSLQWGNWLDNWVALNICYLTWLQIPTICMPLHSHTVFVPFALKRKFDYLKNWSIWRIQNLDSHSWTHSQPTRKLECIWEKETCERINFEDDWKNYVPFGKELSKRIKWFFERIPSQWENQESNHVIWPSPWQVTMVWCTSVSKCVCTWWIWCHRRYGEPLDYSDWYAKSSAIEMKLRATAS